MADFLKAHPYILQFEGGYVNDPDDAGGETYRGISRKNFPNWPGWESIDVLQPIRRGEIIDSVVVDTQVRTFYKRQFWDGILGDQIESQSVGTYLHDWHVNSGRHAISELQNILLVTEDGLFGKGTLSALNKAGADFLPQLHNARIDFYTRIGTNGHAKYLKGWLNRANNLFAALS